MNLIVLAQAAEAAHSAADKAKDAFGSLPPMPNHWPAQVDLLQWAQSMGALTAALLVIAGVIYLGFGVYAFRALITLNAAVMGAWIGAIIGDRAGNAVAGAMVGGFIAAAAAWPLMKYAVAVMGGIVGLALGGTIWRTTNLDPTYAWAGGGMGMIFFGMISFMLFRASVMMYTCLQGSVMLVFGLLGLIYKYQDLGPKVNESLMQRQFLLPLFIFIPATLGLIYQQTQYAGAGAGAPAPAAKK